MKTINKDVLMNLANKNKTSEAVFYSLAARERNKDYTDIGALKRQLMQEGFKIVPQEYIETFRSMAKEGIGEIVETQGQPVKFKWHFSLKDVGKAAISKPAMIAGPTEPKEQPKKIPTTSLVLVLGENRMVKLEYPTDISSEEIKSICHIIEKYKDESKAK